MSTQARAVNPALSHVTHGRRWLQWARIRDFREGSDQVKEQGSLYLPVPSGFDMKTKDGQAEYASYKDRAQLYPVIDRTVDGMVGVAFLQNPTYELPQQMEEIKLEESLTIDCESANTLAKVMLDQNVSVGRFGVLVDLPAGESTKPRPYASKYYAEHIWNWKRQIINGKQTLVWLTIQDGYEKVGDRDGVRFLRLMLRNPSSANPVYVIEEWIFDKEIVFNSSKPVAFEPQFAMREPDVRIPKVAGKPLTFIPFVFVNPKSLQPEIERPPMLDLVDVCKGHYINSANYEHCLHTGAHDTFYIIGKLTDQEKPREIGGGVIWILPESVSEVGTLSSSGQSMDANMDAMVHKEEQMASMGARLIHQQKGQPETAEAVRLNARQNASVMVNTVDQGEAAMTRIFKYCGIMMGLTQEEVESITVTFNRDFIEARLSWEDVKKLVEVWQAGGIDEVSYFIKAKGGGAFPKDLTYEEWLERRDEEKEAGETDGEEVDPEDGDEENEGQGVSRTLEAGDTDHTHTVTLDENGNGTSSESNGHSHAVEGGVVMMAGDDGHTHPLSE